MMCVHPTIKGGGVQSKSTDNSLILCLLYQPFILEMEVQILSKKMVKPEVPTPHHLKTCKLSFLDQLVPPIHVPIVYFYQNNSSINTTLETSELLVKSLSKTLTQFYPLAGRFVEDGFYVDCNDEGVLYIDSQVNLQLDGFLHKATKNMHLLNDLVPRPSFGQTHSFTTPIMGLQVSSFKCGGVAICMHMSHIVADGFTATHFMKEWATTRSCLINAQLVSSSSFSFGFGSLFPSRDLSAYNVKKPKIPMSNIKEGKIITKRFLFEEKAINTLKANVSDEFLNLNQPTRVQVVASVIWKALIMTSKLLNHTLYPTLNIRGRTALTTPLLHNAFYCGNLYMQVPIKFKPKNGIKVEEGELELHHMVKLLRSSLEDAQGNYSKISSPDALFLEAATYANKIQEDMGNEEVKLVQLSSLCRLPLYETDFGWGKPEWVTIPEMPFELVFLLDTKCGKGIEATLSLNEVDMLQFEVDPSIVAFTS